MKTKGIRKTSDIFIVTVLFLFVFSIVITVHNSNIKSTKLEKLENVAKTSSFTLSDNDITYNTKVGSNITKVKTKDGSKSNVLKEEILNRAKAMTEVKWIPDYNLRDKSCNFTFIKGKTYTGVPYSMGLYQASSPDNFLSKINNSKILYGNDCSGLVSTAWGITRQTTLSLYNDIKNRNKIGNKYVCRVSWDDLRPTDALLLDDGKGKGHIMLYINSDEKNSNNLNVYEQNISTVSPYEPIPVARKDVRSKSKLMKKGYMPIRLVDKI
ncbi:C40 family peptidase [Clostridium algoriphilum]|uniref:C40 family peptidase n=1 Tax=Clostridium algoriphilum TaxID=198347 RepID=UPI001CF11887|nr:C40 family peptidase [Clostridium algoriphilum]MCB2294448.1 C40 family peptidase [Clostridium algoriphilum]